jgi:hypothetical protein
MGFFQQDDAAANTVGTAAIIDGSIIAIDLANGSVTNAKLAANAVTNAKLATDAVDTANIVDGAVTADKIADGVIPDVPEVDEYGIEFTIGTEIQTGDGDQWVDVTTQVTLNGDPATGRFVICVGLACAETTDQPVPTDLDDAIFGVGPSIVTNGDGSYSDQAGGVADQDYNVRYVASIGGRVFVSDEIVIPAATP